MEDPSNQTDISRTAAPDPVKAGFRKKLHKPLLIIGVMIAVVFAVLFLFNILIRPYDKTQCTYSNFTIDEGEKAAEISAELEEAGFIANASVFRLTSTLIMKTDFKAGNYYLSPSMDAVSIAKALCMGNVTTDGFIIPEGFTVSQTFYSLARDGFGEEEQFLKAAGDPFLSEIDFIGTDISGPEQVEGFLLPGTYRLDTEADETMIIVTMLDSFSHFYNDDYRARTEELGLTIRDVVTIASMIERETNVESEKARISSVIHNRLNLGMIPEEEFPEIPLCSPGKSSIEAALYPSEDENIYYALSDKLDGTHVFTSDENEYNTFVEAYNKARSERDELIKQKKTAREASEDGQKAEDGSETENNDSAGTEG